jgi:hypothetical protein
LKTHQGFTEHQVRWLSMLVMTRDIFIIPTANCLGIKDGHSTRLNVHQVIRFTVGYIYGRRNDGNVDPNRDFSYGRRSNHCFKSQTAKLFDRLMKATLTQIFITFHGGMVALGYEWGSINHLAPKDRSPDDNCNKQIGW